MLNQSYKSQSEKKKTKKLPELDSTVEEVRLIDPIDTALKGIVGTPPLLTLISNPPKLRLDFKFEVEDDEEANFVLK